MKNKLYIYGAGNYSAIAGETSASLKNLVKKVCGDSLRRADRITQLALLAACDCVKKTSLPVNTGMYLSSLFGSFNNNCEILGEIFHKQELPSPFRFINTVGNTASFYLATHFGIASCSMFISQSSFALQSAIQLAFIDIDTNRIDAALIGVVSEAGQPLAIYKDRLQLTSEQSVLEGAWFFLMANDLPGATALAEVEQQIEFSGFDAVRDFLSNLVTKDNNYVSLVVNENIEESYIQELFKSGDYQSKTVTNSGADYCQFPEGVELYNFINSAKSGMRFCYIDYAKSGRWNIMAFKKV